jgi:hypothetical protein
LKQKFKERTHIQNGENSGSLLDVIFSKIYLFKKLKIIPNIHSKCSHLALDFKIPIQKLKNIMKKIEIRVKNESIIDSINSGINQINWNEIINNSDFDTVYNIFIRKSLEIINKFSPIKCIRSLILK